MSFPFRWSERPILDWKRGGVTRMWKDAILFKCHISSNLINEISNQWDRAIRSRYIGVGRLWYNASLSCPSCVLATLQIPPSSAFVVAIHLDIVTILLQCENILIKLILHILFLPIDSLFCPLVILHHAIASDFQVLDEARCFVHTISKTWQGLSLSAISGLSEDNMDVEVSVLTISESREVDMLAIWSRAVSIERASYIRATLAHS
jgi:hypothetical protein